MPKSNNSSARIDKNVGNIYGSNNIEVTKSLMTASALAHMPVILISDPGTGKTATINAWSHENGWGDPICVIGSQMDPTDVAGIPFPSEDHKYTEYLRPVWQEQCLDGGPHVLFFDEFSNTPRSVQAGLLKIIGERRFADGTKLPDDVYIVGAMNPEHSAAAYESISAPMQNRIMFLSFSPSDKEFFDGMTGGWFPDWDSLPEAEREWRIRVVDFLRTEPQLIHKMPDPDRNVDADSSRDVYSQLTDETDAAEREILMLAWPSPRAWDNCCRVLGKLGFDRRELTPAQTRVVAGICGRECASDLEAFVRRTYKIDPFDAIKNPGKYVWDMAQTDSATELTDLASRVIQAVPKCDGKSGRPTPEQALSFFEKMPELHGSPLFAPHISANGDGMKNLKALERQLGSAEEQNRWRRRLLEMLVTFHKEGLTVGN